MDISFDRAKRRRTLEERGLDLADAVLVFEGEVRTVLDDRYEYGEDRYNHRWPPTRAPGRDGLDPARANTSHHLNEALS